MTVEQSVIDALRTFSSPSVANAIERFDVRPRDEGVTDGSVRAFTPALGVAIGYAATMRITSYGSSNLADNIALFRDGWEHVTAQPAPRIIVVEDVDEQPARGALWGEVNANVHLALGCEGVLTNGAVRDLPEMEAAGFRIFAGSIAVSHTNVCVLDVGTPVTVCGMTVEPGDLIHADLHGAVNVPHELAAKLPDALRELEARERAVIEFCRSPEFSAQALAKAMGLA